METKLLLDFSPIKGYRIGYAPVGKPYMSVICYQIDELLIDTGPANSRRALMGLLDPKTISRICLTHYHEDHAGNAAYLSKHHNIPVYGHALAAEILKKPVKLKPYEKYIWGNLETIDIHPLGDSVETENYRFTLIHTPGHSDDHIVYWEKNQGWLFSGDMYLGSRIKYFRADESISQTIDSLKKITSLQFDKLFCGHNPKLEQPHEAIQRKIDHLENIIGNVQYLYTQGKSHKEILQELVRGRESWLVKIVSMGDVSYKNMVLSAIKDIEQKSSA